MLPNIFGKYLQKARFLLFTRKVWVFPTDLSASFTILMAKMSVEKSIWTTIWKGIFCICTAWKMFIFEVHDFYSKTHSFKMQARLQFSDSFYVLFFFVVKHFLRQLHKRKFPCERDPSDVAYAAPKICSTFDGFHFLNFLGSLCHSWQFLQSLCESWSLMTQTAKIIDFYSLFNQLYTAVYLLKLIPFI